MYLLQSENLYTEQRLFKVFLYFLRKKKILYFYQKKKANPQPNEILPAKD